NQEGLSSVVGLLQKQNYEIKPLNLAATDTVPSDARAVIIAGPQQPLSEAEVAKLKQYLDKGNASLIALVDPPAQTVGDQTPAPDPLLDYLQTGWGVTARNDLAVDLSRSIQNQPFFPVAANYGTSSITDRLQGFASFFPLARSLEYTTTVPELTQVSLVQLSDQSWGETNITAINQGTLQPDEGEAVGPLTVGVSVENSTTKARVIVFGDSDFAADSVTNEFANANLFVNSVNWATLDETLINLTPKIPPQRTLNLVDAVTGYAIFFVVVIALPVLVLVAGGIVWFLRRRQV
ncbi:MAG: Gldg family protein, partial [Anaerolineales bacterium]